MHIKTLESRCIDQYGEENGKKLYRAMQDIHEIDFCVATGWAVDEISIAQSCNYRGRIFKLSKDFRSLIMPDGVEKSFRDLNYSEIKNLLPKKCDEPNYKHCDPDSYRRD